MKAVIMVGGQGMRLRPLTEHTPKPLLPIGGKPLLRITLEHLKACGFTEIFLCTNYKAEMFDMAFADGMALGLRLHYSNEREPLGTAGPLSLIKEQLQSSNEPFLVMNGDLLTDTDLAGMAKYHVQRGAALTLGTRMMTLPTEYGKVELDGDRIVGMVEKPNVEMEINAGIYIISPETLDLLGEGKTLMTDFIRDLIERDEMVVHYRLPGMWLDIGRMSDYERANAYVQGQ